MEKESLATRAYVDLAKSAQLKWDFFLDNVTSDQLHLWIIVPILIIKVFYFGYGGLFVLMDLTNKPKFMRKYKTQPGTNEPLSWEKAWQVLKVVVFNHAVIGIIMTYGLYLYMKDIDVRVLPSFTTMVMHIIGCAFLQDLAFYYSHRLLHHKRIYKYIHKKHHEWSSPVAWASVYCHPVEHIFANMGSTYIGVFLIRPHVVTSWIWITLTLIKTINDHSGYRLPFCPTVDLHDYHHET